MPPWLRVSDAKAFTDAKQIVSKVVIQGATRLGTNLRFAGRHVLLAVKIQKSGSARWCGMPEGNGVRGHVGSTG